MEGLGEMGDLAAIDPLYLSVLADDDVRVRLAAARGLGKMSHPRAFSLVWGALIHKDPDVRVGRRASHGGNGQ